MELLITDLTEMGPDTFCVAGWDLNEKKMVRPLRGGHHWPTATIEKKGIKPGRAISCDIAKAQVAGSYPHQTEDTSVDEESIKIVDPPALEWLGPEAPGAATTLQAAFEGHVQHNRIWQGARKGVYVPDGTRTRSLYGLKIPRTALSFTVDGKLRAILQDEDGRYDLPVVSHTLLEQYRSKRIEEMNAMLPPAGDVHVRVGLARAWEERPGECFVMVNGIFW